MNKTGRLLISGIWIVGLSGFWACQSERGLAPIAVSSSLPTQEADSGQHSGSEAGSISPVDEPADQVPPGLAVLPSADPVPEPTEDPDVEPLPAPSGLRVTGLSKNSVILLWDELSQASAYRVYQDRRLIAIVDEHLLSVKELSAGHVYRFSVAALDQQHNEGLAADLEVRMPSGSSGGGGGGGSGSTSGSEGELGIAISQNPVPGPGHPVYLSAEPMEAYVGLPASAFGWDCLENCSSFAPTQGARVVWTAPENLDEPEQSFTLQLTVTLASGAVLQVNKTIQVLNHFQDLNVTVRGVD